MRRAVTVFRTLITAAYILATTAAEAGEKPGGGAKGSAGQPSRLYETVEQLKAMPVCKATVDEKSPCSVQLRMADGNRIHIGGPGSAREIGGFLGTLKVGQAYRLPQAFLDYLKARK